MVGDQIQAAKFIAYESIEAPGNFHNVQMRCMMAIEESGTRYRRENVCREGKGKARGRDAIEGIFGQSILESEKTHAR